MVREKMKRNDGRLFLTIESRFVPQYYQESGVFDIGTPHEEPYLYWTRFREYAHGFPTVKSARAMAGKLWEERGIRVQIVNREGVVI